MPACRPLLFRSLTVSTVVVLGVTQLLFAIARADDGPATPGFRPLLDRRQRETLRAVIEYIDNHPSADDVDQAAGWAFETAQASGLESEVIPLAEKFVARRDLEPASRQLAQSVLCMGLARGGKLPEAMTQFEGSLLGARLQSPFKVLDLASALAAQARLAGNLEASRTIYERVAASFPLNAQIGEIVEGRIARQELIGKPAPAVKVNDVQGQPFELASLAGKVVLVDFWGTTCVPCLAEFPNLRQLYREFHDRGFEIVGVSFDDSPATVESFATRTKLPWRMVMNVSSGELISDRFRTRTIPALFLIDAQGVISQVDVRGNDLRVVIERLLKGEK
jgi:peroxiredoxin